MAIYVDKDLNIELYKGDTDSLVFRNLPHDKIYSVYFSIFNEDNGKILYEMPANEFNQTSGSATFCFTQSITNDLKVGEHTWALKMCCAAENVENTVVPKLEVVNGEIVQQPSPMFTVLDKRVEGV